ncbi:MAG: hypothetical protein D6706_04415 [Chloroflexi bacterium]|nr:MAG: hypothetical protein D6706_04415 [Chloroflexota bacterium]
MVNKSGDRRGGGSPVILVLLTLLFASCGLDRARARAPSINSGERAPHELVIRLCKMLTNSSLTTLLREYDLSLVKRVSPVLVVVRTEQKVQLVIADVQADRRVCGIEPNQSYQIMQSNIRATGEKK